MYKNLIINRSYDENTNKSNEINEIIPYFFLKSTHYKIDQLRIEFQNNVELIVIKTKNVLVDILNGIIESIDFPIQTPTLRILYLTSEDSNNAILYDSNEKEYHFNLISSGFFTPGTREAMLDSDWFEFKDKINLQCYNQDFQKIAIKNIYLNIKFKYENPDLLEFQKGQAF
jgi:hypothetical protein